MGGEVSPLRLVMTARRGKRRLCKHVFIRVPSCRPDKEMEGGAGCGGRCKAKGGGFLREELSGTMTERNGVEERRGTKRKTSKTSPATWTTAHHTRSILLCVPLRRRSHRQSSRRAAINDEARRRGGADPLWIESIQQHRPDAVPLSGYIRFDTMHLCRCAALA